MAILTLNNQALSIGGQVLAMGADAFKYVNICTLSSYGCATDTETCACGCLYPNLALNTGECYSVSLNWRLQKDVTTNSQISYVCVTCNGTCIRGCSISGTVSKVCSGCFTSFNVTSIDCINIINYATFGITDCGIGASSCVCINSITSASGICKGSYIDQIVMTCTGEIM